MCIELGYTVGCCCLPLSRSHVFAVALLAYMRNDLGGSFSDLGGACGCNELGYTSRLQFAVTWFALVGSSLACTYGQ